MGALELQIFVSLIVVLGAAFAALICDFLKGNVEQLREANLELRVRQEERERQETLARRSQRNAAEQAQKLSREVPQVREKAREVSATREAPAMRASAAAAAAGPAPALADARAIFEDAAGTRRRGRHNADVAAWANELLERKRAEAGDRTRTARTEDVAAPAVAREQVAPAAERPAPATADLLSLPGPAVQQPPTRSPQFEIEGAAVAPPAAPAPPDFVLKAEEARLPLVSSQFSLPANPVPAAGVRPATAVVSLVSESASFLPSLSLLADPTLPVLVERNVSEAAAPPSVAIGIRAIDGSALFSPAEPQEQEAEAETRTDTRGVLVKLPISGRTENRLEIPGGLRGRDVLDRLMSAPEPFLGLVLSVGIVDYNRLLGENGKTNVDQVAQSFEKMLLSVTRDHDMVCRAEADEWVILCPREIAASAQRRIALISERLWDFQLRSLGCVSILFSWGASECLGGSLPMAMSAAHDEMVVSRRTRRGGLNLSPRSHRRVVNG